MTTEEGYQVVFVTVPGIDEGERIAVALVEERLAACVNVIPVCRSIYRWEGRIEHDDETLMIVKAAKGDFAALESRVTELHPYDVPEIVAVDLDAVSAAYLAFLRDSLAR